MSMLAEQNYFINKRFTRIGEMETEQRDDPNKIIPLANFSAKTQLDKLILKKGFAHQSLLYFKGKFNISALCIDPVTGEEEWHDYLDIVSGSLKIPKGTEIKIKNDNLEKNTTFQALRVGTFYKWVTKSGIYFVLTQDEVNSLSIEEKRFLKMN